MFPVANFMPVVANSRGQLPDVENITEDQLNSIINDVFILNLFDKRKGKAELYDDNQCTRWCEYFRNKIIESIPRINRKQTRYSCGIDNKILASMIEGTSKPVYEMLINAKGKISLCGGAVIDIISENRPNDFDLFFHSCTVQEADDILNMLLDNKEIEIYERSARVVTIHIDSHKIQFIKRLYETKDQILLGFDLAASRHGWNPYDGYFTTICGAFSHAMSAFPLDVTQRSLSHGHRLDKYLCKGFDVFLPGLNNTEVLTNKNDNRDRSDMFEVDDSRYPRVLDGAAINSNYVGCENKIIKSPDGDLYRHNDNTFTFSSNKSAQLSDYDSIYSNWWYIAKGCNENVTFEVYELEDYHDIPERNIRDCICVSNIMDPSDKISTLRLFLGEKFTEYILHINSPERCKQIWNDKLNYYVQCGYEIALSVKSSKWKTENPGSQSFGKFNPIMEDPRKWYGKDNYNPVIVGIKQDRFTTFYHCKIMHNINSDIFKYLCECWFEAEVNDAKERLFRLTPSHY